MSDPLLSQSIERALRDLCPTLVVRNAEVDGWAPQLWRQIADMGLPGISLGEDMGGTGGSLADALEVLRIAGRHALPLPLAESGMLAGWLSVQAGLPIDGSPLTFVPGRREDDLALIGGRLTGTAYRVPWGRAAARIIALVVGDGGAHIVVVDRRDVDVQPSSNLAGEPRDTVTFDGVPAHVVAAPRGITRTSMTARGALSRIALMAGALERVLEITVEYTSERRQFGKPVGSFQAVQQHLVHCAQQSSLVSLAFQAASKAADGGGGGFEIAAAKTLANQAATVATRSAHQAHGAMGMTQEYPLQQLTRRLWSWREEYGAEQHWSRSIGARVRTLGADNLYPLITSGSTVLSGGGAA